ncbi:MAG: bifunctional hydroxymethylpyrimidine kinase/phosphomethylpyrimidine kinase [Candidatus Eremiobacteraeota bacterium]|nr:bifunctional hydroxymethylpyrimidine kinase/phosphomethylpyrimidine kinase [Candidatus Eremiobacteraeota bacterium]
MHDELKGYPLLGSIQNDVGYGFIGNQAVAAVANPLKVRTATMTTGYASARGGVENRLMFAPSAIDFRRGVQFLIHLAPPVLLIGYLARYEYVATLAELLPEYSGIVILDPVIGNANGLYVSDETASAIRRLLVPFAQILTPNRFEALLLTENMHEQGIGEAKILEDVLALGPTATLITSWQRDTGEKRIVNIFGNAYGQTRITAPYYTAMTGYGSGDVLAAALATFTALGASPNIAAVLATAFATLSVKLSTPYGYSTVDPIAVHDLFKPRGVYDKQATAYAYAARYEVETAIIPPLDKPPARLRGPGLAAAMQQAERVGF